VGLSGPPGATKGAQPSFLDEWLAKRKAASQNNPTQAKRPSNVKLQDGSSGNAKGFASADTPNLVENQSISDKKDNNNGNISSNSLDAIEVNNIADELRSSLVSNNNDNDLEMSEKEATQYLKKTKSDDLLKHNDTIYIDREGNLENKDS